MSIPWSKQQLMKANDKLMKQNQRYKQTLERILNYKAPPVPDKEKYEVEIIKNIAKQGIARGDKDV